jgi:hypothetical protein
MHGHDRRSDPANHAETTATIRQAWTWVRNIAAAPHRNARDATRVPPLLRITSP